jgi:molybdate transport system permease protein
MPVDWFPLWLSLRVATLSTIIAVALGVWLAWILAHRDFHGKALLNGALSLPLVLPPTVLGYYLLILAGRDGPLGVLYEKLFGEPLVFTWPAAVMAALLYSGPLLVKSAHAAIEHIDQNYVRAARNLGASEWRIFWRVTLPLVRRPIQDAALLAFARALGDFGVTIMVAGNIPGRTQTMAVAIYDAVEKGNGSLARILVLIASALILAILWLAHRLSPRHAAG